MARRDRSKPAMAYIETLSPQERGALMLILWLNSVVTLTLQAIELLLSARAVRRCARSRRPRATAIQSATSPSTATVLTASAAHKLARDLLRRRLDQGARMVEQEGRGSPRP
jgi:hypothetical protein